MIEHVHLTFKLRPVDFKAKGSLPFHATQADVSFDGQVHWNCISNNSIQCQSTSLWGTFSGRCGCAVPRIFWKNFLTNPSLIWITSFQSCACFCLPVEICKYANPRLSPFFLFLIFIFFENSFLGYVDPFNRFLEKCLMSHSEVVDWRRVEPSIGRRNASGRSRSLCFLVCRPPQCDPFRWKCVTVTRYISCLLHPIFVDDFRLLTFDGRLVPGQRCQIKRNAQQENASFY